MRASDNLSRWPSATPESTLSSTLSPVSSPHSFSSFFRLPRALDGGCVLIGRQIWLYVARPPGFRVGRRYNALEREVMTHTVFIDGEAGTTGLQILERLNGRPEIELIHLGDRQRKDTAARAGALNTADVSILCLPDDASREAVSLVDTSAAASSMPL